jgi:hypothetical protein
MSINAEVSKTGSESALAVIRSSRAAFRVPDSSEMRASSVTTNALHPKSFKKRALKLMKRRAEFKQLVKEGKVAEREPRRGAPQRTEPSAGRHGLEKTPIAVSMPNRRHLL